MFAKGIRIVFAVALCLTARPLLAQSYDFENLALGTMDGQDGWVDFASTPSPTILHGGGVNTTQVAAATGGSSPYARSRARGIASTVQTDSRMEMDAMLGSAGGSLVVFGVAPASNEDPFAFGLETTAQPGFFFFRRSSMFAGNNNLYIPGASSSDWYRLRVEVDYAANGGNGSANVFEKDLTLGDTVFTPIIGMQNLNLGLTASNLANNQIADWTQFEIRVDGSGQIDNLLSSALVTPVPEPGAVAMLCGMGITGSLFTLRRCQRRQ